MPRFMLDTDTCSYIMKRSNHALLKRLSKTPVNDVCISVITKSELLYGVEISPRRQRTRRPSTDFAYVEALDFADEAAPHYADIRAHLKSGGTMIGRTICSSPPMLAVLALRWSPTTPASSDAFRNC